MQNNQPIYKRTRRQRSMAMEKVMEANKRARVVAREKFLKQRDEENSVRMVNVVNDDIDDDDEGDAMEIDVETFLRINSSLPSVDVKKGKKVMDYDANGEESDDSLIVIGDSYNPCGVNDFDVNVNDDYGDVEGLKSMQEEKGGGFEENMGLSSSSSSSEDDESDDVEYKEGDPEVEFSSEEEEFDGDDHGNDDDDHEDEVEDGRFVKAPKVRGKYNKKKKNCPVYPTNVRSRDSSKKKKKKEEKKKNSVCTTNVRSQGCSKKKNIPPVCTTNLSSGEGSKKNKGRCKKNKKRPIYPTEVRSEACGKKKEDRSSFLLKKKTKGVVMVDQGVQCDEEMIDREVVGFVGKGVQCDELMQDAFELPNLVENIVQWAAEIGDRFATSASPIDNNMNDDLVEEIDDKFVSSASPVANIMNDDLVEEIDEKFVSSASPIANIVNDDLVEEIDDKLVSSASPIANIVNDVLVEEIDDKFVSSTSPVRNISDDVLMEKVDDMLVSPASEARIVRDEELVKKIDDRLVSPPSPVRNVGEVDFVKNQVEVSINDNNKNAETLGNSEYGIKIARDAMEDEPLPNVFEENMEQTVVIGLVIGLAAKLPKNMRLARKHKVTDIKGNVEVEIEPLVPAFAESSMDRKEKEKEKEKENDLEFKPEEDKQQKVEQEDDEENAIFDEILENGEVGLEDVIGEVIDTNGEDIPRKFRYGGETVVFEKTIEERELETLFNELDFGLGVCDIGSTETHSGKNEEEGEIVCDSAILQEQLCYDGRHYLIEDEEIGMKCKFCSFVALEIRYVTASFCDNPFGRRAEPSARPTNDQGNAGCQFTETGYDIRATQVNGTRGTVWDLIPGTKNKMYEHQIKGFEFIWTNIEGGIRRDQLDKPSRFGLGGCMICHAPGTGKTRLAIVFLQSFVKQYPMAKPIILAPSSILLTWEEEFASMKIGVPFLNLNSQETDGIESLRHRRTYTNKISDRTIRLSKLCEWMKGKGILGMSYTLFEKLAGERKHTNDNVKRALLKKAGIFVLDEGHTPRNDASKIWKVLSEVDTKRKIILSGTPFQNNIEELVNTMSLVREDFREFRGQYVNPGWRSGTDRKKHSYSNREEEQRIENLKNKMKPYVDIHKGEILKKALRGLFHSVLDLKPSEMQKTYLSHLNRMRNGLQKDHLVSIAAVHPSLLAMTEQVPDFVDKELLDNMKMDRNAGVKIKFLFELIKLSKGEKVLVFSQFIFPLVLIRDLLMFSPDFKWTEGKEFLYMYGKLGTKIRQSLIRKFNDPDSEARVLLASTKACCEGIHLVGASRVVLLDVVWNPSVERQAISRAYRLGQKKDVFVYHLITSGTHEEDKLCRQLAKDRLSELVFKASDGEGREVMCTMEKVSEDSILEEMIQHKETKNMFEKIIFQPKADKLIESFGLLNL